ncbi:CGNR zinc finger domain-containing protein [Brevibacterium luteolum]|uniref:CGNR zinc finger domain-containing protein n=1 Tax=Brevibacterium luteolum TaxID=199591 RepID=UPI001C23FE09|nr:CGNR zinc finger domain-containing protein [Brevibacterium luteolum]MBU8578808.1 CGNR zinc finger domain-containing protein [Brevibacterium luteolum]
MMDFASDRTGAARCVHARGFSCPTTVRVSLARLVEAALKVWPDLAEPYLRLRVGHDDSATAALWTDVGRDGRSAARIWRELAGGSIRSETAARHCLLLLVIHDGWKRIRSCASPDCQRVFADATNALSRRWCAVHSSRAR